MVYLVAVYCLSLLLKKIVYLIDLHKFFTDEIVNNIMSYSNIIIISFIICAIVNVYMLISIILIAVICNYSVFLDNFNKVKQKIYKK